MAKRFRSPAGPALLLVLALVLLPALASCGGGAEADPYDFGVMTFDNLPEDEPTPTPPALDLRQDWVLEVGFAHSRLVTAESLRRTVRDLSLLTEDLDGGIGLDWVVAVHEVTLDAERFFDRSLQSDAPLALQNQYHDLLLSYVEAVQMAGFGSDRLLAAALLVGPSGRSVAELTPEEREEYDRLLLEASFYLSHAERMNELLVEDYQEVVDELRR